ncbi:tunicamycin resistance protein [Gnomoniopsis sp. IMI 355080]|nr:tunicamycin resistance protein [Gnomoniopsis sp. IMI 355080]
MANGRLSRTESGSLAFLSALSVGLLARAFNNGGEPIVASFALTGFAFAATYSLIVQTGPNLQKIFKGVDLSKRVRREIPECAGLICAVVYILTVIIFIPFAFYKDIVAATSGGGNRDVVYQVEHVNQGRFLHKFPHSKLASFLSAIISLMGMALLGIFDDLFDLRWRHKFFMPAIAAIPLLAVYFVDFGVTSVVVPTFLQRLLGTELVHLGGLYYVYMAALAIFCPNSINILAGINGIEVMQSIVITLLLIANDSLYFVTAYPHPAIDSHLFSLFFLLPLLGVSLALFAHNKYPANVFVGDTYCYFAGMVFVVVSIQGHFSKTLVLLLLPQIFNFVYSAPQLFHIVPCPRHRLPRYNAHRDVLEPSMVLWTRERQPRSFVAPIMRLLGNLGLLKVVYGKDEGGKELFVESSNMTIINLWLVFRGPLHERRLAWELSAMQLLVGVMGLVLRHTVALFLFKEDNWGLGSAMV